MNWIFRWHIIYYLLFACFLCPNMGFGKVIPIYIGEDNSIIADTICTDNFRDTVLTFSTNKALSYEWQLPEGASLVNQPNDTTAIINWRNATLGAMQLCVLAKNNCGESQPVCIDLFIQDCNTAPTAIDDINGTFFETATTIFVQNNDTDIDGDDLNTLLNMAFPPSNGTVDLSGKAIIYTPEMDFTGIDSFQYILCDTGYPIQCDSAIVRVTIDHQTPEGVNDFITTPSNTAIAIPVLINDSDPEGSALTIALDTASSPFNGTTKIIDQEIEYTPNEGFTGTDRFEYIVCDSNTPVKCDRATVTVIVLNETPIAKDDAVKVPAIDTTSILVLNNDSDKENGTLIVSLEENFPPSQGTITTNSVEIKYAPTGNFTGVDSFAYVICDDGTPILCDTAVVTVQVINDAPIANNDFIDLPPNTDTLISVLANDIDKELGNLVVSIHPKDTVKNGMTTLINQQILYSPNNNFTGFDTLRYYICDDGTPIQCDTAFVFLTVVNSPPIAILDEVGTKSNESTCYPVLANDSDPENGQLTLQLDDSKPNKHGTATIENQEICYAPDTDFTGLDSLNYIICDDGFPIQCDTTLLIITVENESPIALDDKITTPSNKAVCVAILENDSDAENSPLRITLDGSKLPKNGVVRIEQEEICYTPENAFTGVDSLNYIICDNGSPNRCDTATIRITVDNQAPIALDDVVNTDTNQEVCKEVLANDEDKEMGRLMIFLNTSKLPKHGNATIREEVICYTPITDFSGLDSLCYIVCDNGVPIKCDTARLYISIDNLPPIAQDDQAEGPAGMDLPIPILENDIDPENGPLLITLDPTLTPNDGKVTIVNDSLVYTPDAGFTGTDEWQYSICDNGIPTLCDTAKVIVTILNQSPEAVDDSIFINSGEPICTNVLVNDTDIERGQLTVTVDASKLPTNGIVQIDNNEVCFTPNDDFTGIDSLCYIICDDGIPNQCDTAQVHITVGNTPPIANDDTIRINSDEALCIPVLANDIDRENGVLTITLDNIKLPKNGTATIQEEQICYTPATGFSGLDSLCYIICDDGKPSKCDTAQVFIALNNQPPIALDDAAESLSGNTVEIAVLENDSDPENGELTIITELVLPPLSGQIQLLGNLFIYTPLDGFTGTDQFDYRICDDGTPTLCDTATVVVTILNQAPIAESDMVATPFETPILIPVISNDTDPENGNLDISINPIALPTNGSLLLQNDSILYTPFRGFNGDDQFEYIICDDGVPSRCDTALVTILVINNAPIAVDDAVSTPSNISIDIDLIANDYDPENSTLSVSLEPTNPSKNGVVDIEENLATYIPNLNYTGVDSFLYILCDDGFPMQCDTAQVTITIENKAPNAAPDMVTTPFETPITIPYLENDSDPEEGNLTVVDSPEVLPENGSIETIDNQLIYTPNTGFTGTDQLSYLLCDDGIPIQCDTALITILVPNTKPVAVDDSMTMPCVPFVNIGVLGNDFDVEHDSFTLSLVPTQLPQNGSAVLQLDSILYTPDFLFIGIDSFHYSICDTGMPILCDTATVFVTVNNDAPLAVNDTFDIIEDQLLINNFLNNDSDPNDHPLVVQDTLLAPPSLGALTFQEDGSFTYLPFANIYGQDQFTYIVCDSVATPACDTATVFINIALEGDAPIALEDINITLKNTPVGGNVITNDIEPDEEELLVNPTPIADPIHGSVQLDTNGQYIYTPAEDFLGEDFFSYEVCDDATPSRCDTAIVQILVVEERANQNRPPIGVNDYLQSTVNITVINNVLQNDADPDGDMIGISTRPIQAPAQGKLALSSNGDFTYQPEPDFIGEVTFQYVVFDVGSPSLEDTVTVTIDILPINKNSIFATDDAFVGKEDETISGNILANDFDPENDLLILTTTPIIRPQHGSVFLQEDGTFLYAPELDYFGPDHFVYEVCNEGIDLVCDQATVVLNIFPVVDTLCTTSLPIPSIASDKRVCIGDTIRLFTSSPYPPIILEEPDTTFQFIWFNGNGDTLAITKNSEVEIAATDSLAIAPFSMKAVQEGCVSSFSNLLDIEIINISANPPITISDTIICQQKSFTASLMDHAEIAYQWKAINDSTILSATPTLMIAELDTTTTYEVAINSTLCPLSDTVTFTIQVLPLPKVAIAVEDSSAICPGGTLSLSAITDSLSYQYFWIGPNNFITTASNAVIRNASTENNGLYELIIQDDKGCQSEKISQVIESIQEELQAPTIVGSATNCPSEKIELSTAALYDTSYSFEWINQAGTIISTQADLAILATDSLAQPPYRVRISQKGCSSAYSGLFFVTVSEAPTAQIVSNDLPVCKGSTLPISAKFYEDVNYEWRRIGSPTLFSTEISTILTNIQNEVAIELTVFNPACPMTISKDTLVVTIESNNKLEPTASFDLNEDCSPTSLTLHANITTDFLEVSWTGPNGFSSDQAITTISEATEVYNGTYQVSAIDSLGCISTALLTINDLQGTIAIPTISSKEGAVCENSNILLEASSYEGENVRYLWYKNDTFLTDSMGNTLFINDAQIGNQYDLEIQIGACTLQALPFRPIVLEKPRLDIAPIQPILCATGSESITISTNIEGGQAPLNLSWIGPNDFSSTLANPTILNITSLNAGTYTLKVSDQNECVVEKSIEINIQEGIPKPSILKEGGTCIGEPISLSATTYDDPAVQYDWTFPATIGNTAITSPTITIPAITQDYIGNYTITASIGNCAIQSDTFQLDLSNPPKFQPTADYVATENCELANLSLFANAAGDNLSYQWQGPNNFSSAIANPVIANAVPANNGIYELTVTTLAGCSATLATELVNNIRTSQTKPILQLSGGTCVDEFVIIEAPIYEGTSVQYNWLLNGIPLENEFSNQLTIQTTTNEADRYQLIVEVDGCTLTSDPITPSITALPMISAITKSAIYCEGESVHLTAQSAMPSNQEIEFTWKGPNGFEFVNTTTTDTFDLFLPSITLNQTGSYSLTLKVGDCLSETASILVTVQPGLAAPTLQVQEHTICAGNALSFAANATTSTRVDYEWYMQIAEDSIVLIETTATPNLYIPNATAPNTGSYMVRIVNENCASNFSNIERVVVFDEDTQLRPSSTATEERPGCYGEAVQLSVPFFPTVTYEWIGPAGFTSTRHNPLIENPSELQEGDYFVILRLENCPAIIRSQPITVELHPKPATPIISSTAPICKGESLSFQVMNVADFGPNISFEWFNGNQVLVASTDEPFRNYNNVPVEFSNSYYAIATNGSCFSERSNTVEVNISSVEELIADAGPDQDFCAAKSIRLNGNELPNATGRWQSLSGSSIENSDQTITTAQNLVAGINRFVWTMTDPICGGSASDTVEISVGKPTLDQAIAGADQNLCRTTRTTINAVPLVESEGRWSQSSDQISQGIEIESPTATSTVVKGLRAGNAYRFTWIISQEDCQNFESDEVVITVDDIPNEQAIIPLENQFLCEGNETTIEAALPFLSTGTWSIAEKSDATPPPTPIRIASPNSPSTFIEGLRSGENKLVWTLSNGGCKNFSRDTLLINIVDRLEANPDEYVIKFNDSLTLNIFENDFISSPSATQFIITRYPEFGAIKEEEDGGITYIPTKNYFGKDHFRYKICSTICTESCDTAIVNLTVSGVEGSGSCFIPNTISPNEDGSNDVFLVSCLTEFPDNQLTIYNRWGDKVFEQAPYQNEWKGVYEGQALPSGTYFYVLKLTNQGEPLQGFISLFR